VRTTVRGGGKKDGQDYSAVPEMKDDNKPHRLLQEEETNPWISPEKRLEKRDQLFCDDDAVALAIKSGDVTQIKWLFERGYPMNYNVKDTDGMCYEAVVLARAHAQEEVAQLFQELAVKGPPRQYVTVFYENQSREFVMPNSTDDEKLFRAEIKWFFKLDMKQNILLYQRGDTEKMDQKWNKLREGRKYVVEKA